MENENLTTGENMENKGIDTTGISSDGTNVVSNGTTNDGINVNSGENTIPNVEVISNTDNNSENVTEINVDNNISTNNDEVVSAEINIDNKTEENANNDVNGDNVSASKGGVFANALEDAVNKNNVEKEEEQGQEEEAPVENENVVHKVLIIEDNEAERSSLRAALEADSFVVEAVENGFDAENLVRTSIFDVAIVDYRLPDIDGLNLIKKLKISIPELMSLVVTAHSSVEIAVEALRMGAYDYITKPLNIPALTKTISTMIKERDVAIASRKKLIELQSKGGISYKFNDQLVSVVTTPNPDMLVTGEAKVGFIKKVKRAVSAVKNFYWGS
ncbi:MAG: response regulator [Elusimicrobia bacterium]|nr:response regulator [Elusimicrobiota bacterium]